MFAPLHSPVSERCLPRYSPVMSKIYEAEENPFDALRRGSATSEDASSLAATSTSSLWSNSSISSTSAPSTASPKPPKTTRRPLVTSRTFPSIIPNPLHAPHELEDAVYESILYPGTARTYRLQGSFIYTSQTRNLPRYQLQQRSGDTSALNIRRVQPHETRSCSVPAVRGPRVRYDEAGTLYSISDFDMRGQKVDSLPGSIQMTSGKSLWGSRWTRIWHVTNCKAQHRDCEYRGTCEPEKHLLFAVKKGVWEDAEGVVAAREEGGSSVNDRELKMVEVAARDEGKSDLVVACWVMRLWMAEELRWEGVEDS